MRVLAVLLALAALAGCRLEPGVPADADGDPSAVSADPSATVRPAPRGTQPAPPPDALVNPVGPDGRPEVVLYVTEWCPYCAQAREFMTAEGVPHRVVDIEKDENGNAEYQARGGTGGIPLVAVGARTIQGWSEEVATEMLTEAGYE